MNVNEYFIDSTKNIYIEKTNYKTNIPYLITFKEYNNREYQDNCYHYSIYSIMGLNLDDALVRGKIDVREKGCINYKHGWVEFKYNGNEYVYDSLFGIVEKEKYYRRKSPIVEYKIIKEEIIDIFTNNKISTKKNDEYLVKSFDLIFDQRDKYDKTHMYLPMSESSIFLGDKKLVKKFIGRR